MFNIKVFPNFSNQESGDENGNQICAELKKIRNNLCAKYVNVSFFENKEEAVEAIHFLTYPISWVSQYITSFYSDVDPLLKIDFRTVSFVDWMDLYQTPQQAKLFDRFKEHGLGLNGLTCVHHIERDLYCVLSASFDIDDNNWPTGKMDRLEIMRFQSDQIGEVYNRLFLFSRRKNYNITPRESECLYWVAMGKTDEQISSLLSIGKWTVNGHLQSAKHKLGSPSRSAAVARALISGIIKIRRAI
ncbi:MAG: autoinducer binding domain-containing protein [Salaquimonas sp.]